MVTSRPATGSGTAGVTSTSASGHGPLGTAGGVGVGVGVGAGSDAVPWQAFRLPFVLVPAAELVLALAVLLALALLRARRRRRRGVGGRLGRLVVVAVPDPSLDQLSTRPNAEHQQHGDRDDHEPPSLVHVGRQRSTRRRPTAWGHGRKPKGRAAWTHAESHQSTVDHNGAGDVRPHRTAARLVRRARPRAALARTVGEPVVGAGLGADAAADAGGPGGPGPRGVAAAAGRPRPPSPPSPRARRSGPGAGSATRAGRCGCTPPRPRSSTGTAARCPRRTTTCWRCPGSATTRRRPSRRSPTAAGTSCWTPTCAGSWPGCWPARSCRRRRSPAPSGTGRPRCCPTTSRPRPRGRSR